MTQPSKGAALFLVLFGFPFLGAGLLVIYMQLRGSGNSGTGGTVVSVIVGLVLAVIGAGLIYAAIGGYGRLKKQAAIEEANPLSPWLWRTDWASRRSESLNRKSEITYWVICILCNLILLSVVGGLLPKKARAGDPRDDSSPALRQYLFRIQCAAFFSGRPRQRKNSFEARNAGCARNRPAPLLRPQSRHGLGRQQHHA